MISLVLTVPELEQDAVIADLYEAGTCGITQEGATLRAFFESPSDTEELERRFSAYAPQINPEPERDWAAEFRDSWQPFSIGERFYLVPSWRSDPAPCGRVRLWTYPGMACGTGAHPSTQLCLTALEKYLEPGARMLDVGTGSGILAQAALLLGAGSAFGCDVDNSAVGVARANSARDPVVPWFFAGSVHAIRSGSIDVLAANINATANRQLAPEYERVSRGRLILSGFSGGEASAVAAAYTRPVIESLRQNGWECFVL